MHCLLCCHNHTLLHYCMISRPLRCTARTALHNALAIAASDRHEAPQAAQTHKRLPAVQDTCGAAPTCACCNLRRAADSGLLQAATCWSRLNCSWCAQGGHCQQQQKNHYHLARPACHRGCHRHSRDGRSCKLLGCNLMPVAPHAVGPEKPGPGCLDDATEAIAVALFLRQCSLNNTNVVTRPTLTITSERCSAKQCVQARSCRTMM
jgi:hypothetical protein